MSSLFNMPWSQVFDGSGNTLAGAKLYFYEAGTSTLKNIYADIDMTTALSNPVIADAGGRFVPIYFDGQAYKVALYTANDVLIWTADHVENQTSEADAAFAIAAIKQTSLSAGYSSAESEVAENFSRAVYKYANGANWYTETGTDANIYVLTQSGTYDRPNDYFAGMEVNFLCTRANTSTSATVNVAGLGTKNIRRADGSNISVGDIGGLMHMVYNGTYFVIGYQTLGNMTDSISSSSTNGQYPSAKGVYDFVDAKFTIVAELPQSPDADTFYFIPEE